MAHIITRANPTEVVYFPKGYQSPADYQARAKSLWDAFSGNVNNPILQRRVKDMTSQWRALTGNAVPESVIDPVLIEIQKLLTAQRQEKLRKEMFKLQWNDFYSTNPYQNTTTMLYVWWDGITGGKDKGLIGRRHVAETPYAGDDPVQIKDRSNMMDNLSAFGLPLTDDELYAFDKWRRAVYMPYDTSMEIRRWITKNITPVFPDIIPKVITRTDYFGNKVSLTASGVSWARYSNSHWSAIDSKIIAGDDSDENAVATGKKSGVIAWGMFDSIMRRRDYYWHSLSSDTHNDVGSVRVKYLDRNQYIKNVQSESDPVKYLELLSLAYAAGYIFKNTHKEYMNWAPYCNTEAMDKHISNTAPEIWKSTQAPDMSGKDDHRTYERIKIDSTYSSHDFSIDEAQYTILIQQFEEVLTNSMMKEVYHTLNLSRLEDLPILRNSYSAMLNRVLMEIPSRIMSAQTVDIIYDDTTLATFKCHIPNDFSQGPKVILSNYNGGKPMTAAQSIMEIFYRVIQVMLWNLSKAEARIAQLEDKNATIVQTPQSLDPYFNPMTVYDQAASEASGKATFTNVAVNKSASWKEANKTVVDESGPTVSDYALSPYIRGGAYRLFETEDGLSLSEHDINILAGTKKKSNLTPWLIGGAAAAAGILQLMS